MFLPTSCCRLLIADLNSDVILSLSHANQGLRMETTNIFGGMDEETTQYFQKKTKPVIMDVSKNSDTPNHSSKIGNFFRKPSVWGTLIFGNIHL